MMVIPLDDFDLILGVEFLVKAKESMVPHLRGIFIGDENAPCFVQAIGQNGGKGKELELQSAKQFKARVKKGQQACVVALIEIKPNVLVEVPNAVVDVLEEFANMMPPELSKELPPHRAVNDKIELEPVARPLAKVSYQMAPLELVELRKQLDELLEAGFIQSSKVAYGAPVLF